MSPLVGVLHALALVLAVTGFQKLLDPAPAAAAMRAAGLPRMPGAGRALGIAELAIALGALAVPTPATAGLVALAYAGLAAFVVRLRSQDATAGCGCFGAADAPPTAAHVIVDLAAAGLALGAAATGSTDLLAVLEAGVGTLVPHLLAVATLTGLVLVGPALVADLADASRPSRPRSFGSVR